MVKFSPWGNQQFFDANGDPAVGWKIYAYAAGASALQSTYTDSTGATPQTNPIVLNALGFPTTGQIWLTSGLAYKLVLTDADGVVQKTEDNIAGVNDASNVAVSQWNASGVIPTYISASSFSLLGDQTTEFHVGRRGQFATTAGTVYGTIASSAFTTLTTVTLTMDAGQALDSGLSAVNLSILRFDHLAVPAFPQLLAANGYKELGNGLILQWGTTAASNGSGQATFAFPIPFPSAALFAISNANSGAAASNGYTAISATSVTVPIFTTTTAAPAVGVTATVFIIGH